MILLLMRHGIAEDLGDGSDIDDAMRRLTEKGRRRVRDVAEFLRRLDCEPTHYLSSGRLRALETAREVADCLDGADVVHQLDSLDFGAEWPRFVNDLRAVPDLEEDSIVLAAGHQPGLSTFITQALTGQPLPFDLKRGAVVALRWEGLPEDSGASLYFATTAAAARRLDEED